MSDAVHPNCFVTFDVETYFQVESATNVIAKDQWENLDPRLEPIIENLLLLLDRHHAKSTFFTLGWVGQKLPKMIKRIADAGHEIACHGNKHDRLHRMTPVRFREDINAAKTILEDIIGQPVVGYRAPTFSIDHTTAWAVDILHESGFIFDSSVQPIYRKAYGVPEAPCDPYRLLGPQSSQLIELPPLTWTIANYRMPVAGGGYFRLFPLQFMRNGINQTNRRGQPAMLYFHPWEFDPDQPRMPLQGIKKWRHYVGLARTTSRLDQLLDQYQSTTVSQWLKNQPTEQWPSFKLDYSPSNPHG